MNKRLGFLTEAKLKYSQRSDFGLPLAKKYPMPDKSHVLAAIRMFNHAKPYEEGELAHNIKLKMKQYGISPSQVGEGNRLKQYLQESEFVSNKERKKLEREFSRNNIARETSSAIGFTAGTVLVPVPFVGSAIGSIAGRVAYDKGKKYMPKKIKRFIDEESYITPEELKSIQESLRMRRKYRMDRL